MTQYEELVNIVGKDKFIDDPETLSCYAQDESFARALTPWAIVKPSNTEEVESIVKWANKTGTPLVPVSSAAPHFRGDSVPTVPGSLIVDLSNMNRIIKIDRRNKIAWIEPGVTWDQLQPELAKEGMVLPMPLIPKKSKSVIASFLEREPITVPKYQWTLLDPLRCCEVVWGSGDKMWTGEAGDQQGTLEERWSKFLLQIHPLGPYQTDFYRFFSAAQGSMGIVTCATVKCEVLPQIHKLAFVSANNLDKLIDFAYKILKIRYGYDMFILNSANLANILCDKKDEIRDLKGKLPAWTLLLGLAGLQRLPVEKVKYQEKEIREIAEQHGLSVETNLQNVDEEKLLDIISKPSMKNYWKLDYKGGFQEIFFVTTLNKTPGYVDLLQSVSQNCGYDSEDIGIYIQPLMQGTSCHCEFVLPYAPDNQLEIQKTKNLVEKGSRELMKQGAFFSRPYGSWSNMVYGSDAQTTHVLKKLKGIFDPNNVMNPGKLCF